MFRTSGTCQPIYVLHRHTPRYLVGESGDQEGPSLNLPDITPTVRLLSKSNVRTLITPSLLLSCLNGALMFLSAK